jgi:hypothetical protein
MVKKPFNHLSYADLFPLVKKFFKKNTKWHPLTGDLPFDFLSQEPNNSDMRCVELILKARGLWRALSWKPDDPDLLATQNLFDRLQDVLSRSSKGNSRLGPDQVPESALLDEARQETGPIESYKIFSVVSIHFAWDALRKMFSGQRIGDQAFLAETFFNKAQRRWFYEVQRKREILQRGSKGGKADKKAKTFFRLCKRALKESPKGNTISLWRFIKRNCLDTLEYDIEFDEDENKFYEHYDDGRSRPISFRTFQRYISDLKKNRSK